MGTETFQSTLNLKESFLWAATKKKRKLKKNRESQKNIEKENNSNENDFSENEFWILSKKNIRDITSSSSNDEEESAEYEVKQISDNEWCERSAKADVDRYSSK